MKCVWEDNWFLFFQCILRTSHLSGLNPLTILFPKVLDYVTPSWGLCADT